MTDAVAIPLVRLVLGVMGDARVLGFVAASIIIVVDVGGEVGSTVSSLMMVAVLARFVLLLFDFSLLIVLTVLTVIVDSDLPLRLRLLGTTASVLEEGGGIISFPLSASNSGETA